MIQVSKLRYRLRSTYAKWQIIFIHLIFISASGGVSMSLYKYIHIVSDSTNSYYRVKTMFCAWWIYGKRKTLRTWHFGASTQRITYYTRYRYLFKQYILEKNELRRTKRNFRGTQSWVRALTLLQTSRRLHSRVLSLSSPGLIAAFNATLATQSAEGAACLLDVADDECQTTHIAAGTCDYHRHVWGLHRQTLLARLEHFIVVRRLRAPDIWPARNPSCVEWGSYRPFSIRAKCLWRRLQFNIFIFIDYPAWLMLYYI